MNRMIDFAQKLMVPAKELQTKGLPIHAYLTELTWLLFLKMAPILGKIHLMPSDYRWEALIQKSDREQYNYYQEVIKALNQVSDPFIAGLYAHADTSFKTPEQLAQVITTLSAIDIPIEDLGEVYEILLERCAYLDGRRLHQIPRSLVDLMVILTQPQPGELIQDPLAGTANFVVAANEYRKVISEEFSNTSFQNSKNPTKNQKKFWTAETHFIAVEPDLVRQRLALMNCLLHHINHSQHLPVRWGDSLLSNLDRWPQADVILSVLVFASDLCDESGKHDASLALLQHIYQTLKPGGRAAVILPDKLLSAAGPAQQVRGTLLDSCVLHTVLRLPHGIFYPYKVPAHLLFFWRGHGANDKTKNVWFYDLRAKCPIFGQYLRLKREHLMPFEKIYGDDPYGKSKREDDEENGWHCFSRTDLSLKEDKLDLCWLTEAKTATDNLNTTGDIWEVLEKTVDDLEDLTRILCE
jgi:type I restriction enzyme M protein